MKIRWDQKDPDWRIGDGVVQDTSGDVIFTVPFKAITCLPEVNEVLDGRVIEVTSSGITVQSGSIKCFVQLKVKLEIDLLLFRMSTSTTSPPTSGRQREAWTKSLTRVLLSGTASRRSSSCLATS